MDGKEVVSLDLRTDEWGKYQFEFNENHQLGPGVYIARISTVSGDGTIIESYSKKLIIK
jgi:methionine-rich copper-binding protein CopC